MRIDGCRSCGGSDLVAVLDLGRMPLADRLRSDGTIDDDEPRYPLELAFCRNCALVQITYTVPPEELFCRDYPYFRSEEHTSELQSLMRISYAVFCLKKTTNNKNQMIHQLVARKNYVSD